VRSVIAHAVLAVGGLLMAWLVWTDQDTEERPADAVDIFDCSPDDLTAVSFQTKNRNARLEVRADGDEKLYWITVERTPDRGEPSTDQFVGGETVPDYIELIAPLRALRSLGDLDDDQLEDLELKDHPATFVMECGGQTRTWKVGGAAFGSGDRYFRASSGGPVYFVAAGVVRELETAEFRLMQRNLQPTEWTEVETLQVRAFDNERRLMQRHRREPQQAEWVDAAEPDRRNELYGNWLELLNRLRVQSYLAPDARPGSDLEGVSAPPVPVLRLEYFDEDGDSLGTLELVRVDAQEPQYYAKSNATRAWVKVTASVARQIEDDVRPVVGLEPIHRQEPSPEPAPEAETPAGGPGPVPDAPLPPERQAPPATPGTPAPPGASVNPRPSIRPVTPTPMGGTPTPMGATPTPMGATMAPPSE